MRAKIGAQELESFLQTVKSRTGRPWSYLAREVGNIHPRTLRDWRRGKFTPSLDILKKMAVVAGIKLPPIEQQLTNYWYVPRAAQLGGKRTYELYGALGTPAGRRLGGLHSMQKHRERGDWYATAKEITSPNYSENLAEFIGIVLGDGGISRFQVIISLHREDDKLYVDYVGKLIEELFQVTPSFSFREAVCSIVISRVKLVTYLKTMGLPVGSKVKHQASVPSWIVANDHYSRACIRGLVDTDGCFYIDRHRYKEKMYLNPGLNFTNRSLPLLQFCKTKLEEFGFTPRQTSRFSIALRKEVEIMRYLQEIGTSNPKVKNKYLRYRQEKYTQ